VIAVLAAAPITITIGCVCKVILMLLWLPGQVSKKAV
jgi:hypothetical protein